ncbi:MAG: hypothetical protein ACR2P8_15920 [Myxococcota bacterium]
MNRDSMKALRLDRRLLRRRGWISPEDLEEQLASLPDVSDKMQLVDVAGDAPAPEAPEPGDPESPTGF